MTLLFWTTLTITAAVLLVLAWGTWANRRRRAERIARRQAEQRLWGVL